MHCWLNESSHEQEQERTSSWVLPQARMLLTSRGRRTQERGYIAMLLCNVLMLIGFCGSPSQRLQAAASIFRGAQGLLFRGL